MSSLWTPEGEHRVAREDAGVDPAPRAPSETTGAAPDDEEEAVRAEMAELERQLAAAPVEDVVANHCYGLFQLAALHLGQSPPRLDAARLAIDALAAVVESLGDRLGDPSEPLRDGLAQIRLAFVQIAGADRAAALHPDAEAGAPDDIAPEAPGSE